MSKRHSIPFLFTTFMVLCLSFVVYAQDTTVTVVPEPPSMIIQLDSSAFSLYNDFLDMRDSLEQAKQAIETESSTNLLEVLAEPNKIVKALIFGILAYLVITVITKVLYFIASRDPRYKSWITGGVPIFRIIFWIVVAYIMIAGIFKPPTQALVALGASIGVAVGFASQDILKNVFGGIVILIDRPFIVGDKIEVGNYYGTVTDIGLRSTRIVTPDDSLVTVPNSEMVNSSVSNSNAGERDCQVVAELFLPLTIDTEEVRKIAIEAAQVSSYVYLNKPIVVIFVNIVQEFRTMYKMRLKAYVMEHKHEFQFKSEMTEIVMRELLKKGIITKKDLYPGEA